ncbi:MAG TPA: DUF1295 domain-containing protein [bacterium]|nr:DUF1295 domain-containing protein [bacterium]HPS28666.1 DUF1295 domain-containing protein [bacterium]
MKTIYETLIAVQIISAVFTFIALYFVTAGYGRHASKSWGFSINPRLGWLLMESPVVFIPIYFAITGTITSVTGIMLAIWLTHYIQRTFIYPFLIRGEEKMPLLIVLFSLIFNSMNGFINGYYLFNIADYSLSWLADPRFIAGTLFFFTGMVINIHSDHVVRKLRKENGTGYFLPEKGFHKFVASPNYFGEILEWTGWAILTWSLPGLAFMIFTMANLVPRANKHREWYRKTFGDKYPSSRKRIFPFIY